MRTARFSAPLILLLLLTSTANGAGGNKGEDEHQLSLAGGIAAPAYSTAVFQNPAGFVYNSSFKLSVQGGAGDNFNNPLLRGGALTGNGSFGAGALLGHRFSSSSNNTSSSARRRADAPTNSSGSDRTDVSYGLGLNLDALKTAFGVAAQTELSPGSGTSFNAGALIHPFEKLRFGVTAIGLDDGVQEWGLGVATELASSFSFVLDTSFDSRSKHFAAQPAVALGNATAALTVGYGFNDGSRQLSNGFSAGGSLKLGSSTSWQLYYNQLATFYTAISFGF